MHVYSLTFYRYTYPQDNLDPCGIPTNSQRTSNVLPYTHTRIFTDSMGACRVSHYTDTRTHNIHVHTYSRRTSSLICTRRILYTHTRVLTRIFVKKSHLNLFYHLYIHSYIHTYIHIYIHTNPYVRMYKHICIYASSYVVDMYEQVQMVNSCTLILRQGDDACTICLCRTHTHTHTHQRIQIYTHTHTCTHTHMLTLTHPPIHAHIQHVRTVIA